MELGIGRRKCSGFYNIYSHKYFYILTKLLSQSLLQITVSVLLVQVWLLHDSDYWCQSISYFYITRNLYYIYQLKGTSSYHLWCFNTLIIIMWLKNDTQHTQNYSFPTDLSFFR